MKPNELKQEFIKLRAGGKSYSQIAEELHISKSTCTKWERDFAAEINDLKRAELAELHESYGMAKEARIRALGGTLAKINEAIDKADFSEVDPAKLLDYKLRYMEALKGEYVGALAAVDPKDVTAEDILSAFADVLNRSRAGDITQEQAQRESALLANLLKAYETTKIKTKLEELEAIVGGR